MSEQPSQPTWQEEVLERLKERSPVPVHLGDALVWAVQSDSDPMEFHYVLYFVGSGKKVCACKGFRFTGHCWHLDATPS